MSVVSQFITLASFSFSDVEDLLAEAKELVRSPMPLRSDLGSVSFPRRNSPDLPRACAV